MKSIKKCKINCLSKRPSCLFLVLVLAGGMMTYLKPSVEENFSVSFLNPDHWGEKLNETQVCYKFGSHQANSAFSPSFVLSHIPSAAVDVVFSYNDTDYEHMDNGGHGIYGYKLPANRQTVVVPAIMGEQAVPQGFFAIQEHLSQDWSGTQGVYLPPCSGGQGHVYTVTVSLRDQQGQTIEQKTLTLGQF